VRACAREKSRGLARTVNRRGEALYALGTGAFGILAGLVAGVAALTFAVLIVSPGIGRLSWQWWVRAAGKVPRLVSVLFVWMVG